MKPELLLLVEVTQRMMDQFEAAFEVHKYSEINDIDAWLKMNGDRIQAIATDGHIGVPQNIMDGLPKLEIISSYGVGYDAINTNAAVARNIMVTHTPGVLNADVANLAILLMLATSRCLIRDDRWVRDGKWETLGAAPLTRSIEGKKVGIVGLGRIGGEIAEKLQIFRCEVMYHTRNPKDVPYQYHDDLAEMASDVDYLIAITPGGPSTSKLIDRQVMNALGPDGTLINVARGSVVDEAELVLALEEGRLGWAGLDVFEAEPQVPKALFAMDNVVLTPHVASATVETRQAMGDLTVENLVRYFADGNVSTPVPECNDLA